MLKNWAGRSKLGLCRLWLTGQVCNADGEVPLVINTKTEYEGYWVGFLREHVTGITNCSTPR